MFYTYFHTRNDTGSVFYIGKGKGQRAFDSDRNPHWKSIAAKHGHAVHMAMTGLSEQDAFAHVKFLIKCFKDMGITLTNCTDGGEGSSGATITDEHRAKISAAQKARPPQSHTLESRVKIGLAHIGKTVSAETREKIAATRRGVPRSPETRALLAAINTGRKHSAETRAKLSNARQGKVHTKETCIKISQALRCGALPA